MRTLHISLAGDDAAIADSPLLPALIVALEKNLRAAKARFKSPPDKQGILKEFSAGLLCLKKKDIKTATTHFKQVREFRGIADSYRDVGVITGDAGLLAMMATLEGKVAPKSKTKVSPRKAGPAVKFYITVPPETIEEIRSAISDMDEDNSADEATAIELVTDLFAFDDGPTINPNLKKAGPNRWAGEIGGSDMLEFQEYLDKQGWERSPKLKGDAATLEILDQFRTHEALDLDWVKAKFELR
jgi:hypothetical protein